MVQKNLKHGIRVTKRDVSMITSYIIHISSRKYFSESFDTKFAAINRITSILSDSGISRSDIKLFKVQQIKF